MIMKIFEKLKNFFQNASNQKNYTVNFPLPSVFDITKQQKTINPFVYACILFRSNAVSQLKWDVYEENQYGDRVSLPIDHPVSKWFWRPNSDLTTSELLTLIVMNIDIYGNCFILVEKNKEFSSIILPPNAVSITKIGEKIYSYNGKEYTNQNIIHIRSPLLQNDFSFGKSPLSILEPILNIQNALYNFMARFLERSGVPPIYFAGGFLTDEQKINATIEWNRMYPDFPLRMFISEGEIKSIPISISFNSQQLPDLDKITKINIASFYGIPLAKITGENANYATAFINDYTFWQNSIKPTAQIISDRLTDFFRQFYPNILIGYEEMDFSAIDMFKSLNEKIEKFVIYDDMKREKNINLEPNLYLHWKKLDNLSKKYERNYIDCYKSFLSEIEKLLDNQITNQKGFSISINKEVLYSLCEQIFSKTLLRHFKEVLDFAFLNVGEITPFGYENAIFELKKNSVKKITDWAEEMLLKVKEELGNAIDEFQARKTIFKFTRPNNFNIKAQTISCYVTNTGLISVYQMYEHKYNIVWLSQRDQKVRPAHILADGQIRENGSFRVGGEFLPYPGAGQIPENNINCRCFVMLRPK